MKIQILDLPGIIEGRLEVRVLEKVLSVIRASDLVVLMVDAKRTDWLSKVKKNWKNRELD